MSLDNFVLLNPDDDTEPWILECQPYPRRWLDEQRKEKWATKARLKKVAREMVKQKVSGKDKYRYAVLAGYTSFETFYILKLIKSGDYKK